MRADASAPERPLASILRNAPASNLSSAIDGLRQDRLEGGPCRMNPATHSGEPLAPGEGAPEAPRTRIPLRYKALLLFLPMLLGPVAFSAALLIDVNRVAVRDAERQLQASVLAELAGSTVLLVRSTQSDAEAVAAAFAEAAVRPEKEGEGDPMSAVLAVLATRRAVQAVRFEVPSAGVSTVIQPKGGTADVPSSSPELQRAADERGVGFSAKSGAGVLVVPIPARQGAAAAKGYVTVSVDLGAMTRALQELAEQRFGGRDVSMLLVDGNRAAIASYGVSGSPPGADVGALPIWRPLPAGPAPSGRVGLVSEFSEGSVPMVGAIESVEELGWLVAIWRPEPIAYAALSRMRDRGLLVAAGAVVLAIAAALIAARTVASPIVKLAGQVGLIGQRRWPEVKLASARRDELGDLSRSIGRMAADLQTSEAEIVHQEKLRSDLGRFLSRELVEAIVRGEHSLSLGGERMQVSVVFADVVAFTPLAETHDAKEVVALLNDLFSTLTEIVFRHGGTVDKFIGDCIMAVWGAPVRQPDHAARALAAAEEIMSYLETANVALQKKYGREVRLGIGVNSGEAIVGNIGSKKRMEYTVIGDVVNVAARLEAIAAPNQVLVGEATQAAVADGDFPLRKLGDRKLTGRERAITVYELETG
jgi:adenylate cyclase